MDVQVGADWTYRLEVLKSRGVEGSRLKFLGPKSGVQVLRFKSVDLALLMTYGPLLILRSLPISWLDVLVFSQSFSFDHWAQRITMKVVKAGRIVRPYMRIGYVSMSYHARCDDN